MRGGLSIRDYLTARKSGASQILFSYTPSCSLAGVMRRPETFLLFLVVIPMGYFAVWWLLALIAAA